MWGFMFNLKPWDLFFRYNFEIQLALILLIVNVVISQPQYPVGGLHRNDFYSNFRSYKPLFIMKSILL